MGELRALDTLPPDTTLVVERAHLFRMRDEAHYSRNNAPQELIVTVEGRSAVQDCLVRFASSRAIRLYMVLELADGQALVMYNSLRADVPAQGEPGELDDLWEPPADPWELKIELWPLGVCQRCHCQEVKGQAGNSPKLCRECTEQEIDSR